MLPVVDKSCSEVMEMAGGQCPPNLQAQCPKTCGMCEDVTEEPQEPATEAPDADNCCENDESRCDVEMLPVVDKSCSEVMEMAGGQCPPNLQAQCPKTCGMCEDVTEEPQEPATEAPDAGNCCENDASRCDVEMLPVVDKSCSEVMEMAGGQCPPNLQAQCPKTC